MLDDPCTLLELNVDSLFANSKSQFFAFCFTFKYLQEFEIDVRESESHERELIDLNFCLIALSLLRGMQRLETSCLFCYFSLIVCRRFV